MPPQSLCRRIFSSLSSLKALLIGTGETGELVYQHLQAAGLQQWWITNRTAERGTAFTQRLGGAFIPFENFSQKLIEVDLVITATSAPQPLLTKAMLEHILSQKKRGTLCLIDLSVPRNIALEVGELEEVICYNIEDLKEMIASNLAIREKEAKRAEQFIQEMVQKFSVWKAKTRKRLKYPPSGRRPRRNPSK
jgi:glutamyl-tRNA reductase